VIAPTSRATPLRVILDANVLLFGIFFGGVPVGCWRRGRIQSKDACDSKGYVAKFY
jgi:hypothetical protein